MESIRQVISEWSPVVGQEIADLIDVGQYTEALRSLREYPPEDPEVARLLWRCDAERGNHHHALKTLASVPQQNPHLHLLAARSSLALGRWVEAERYARASFEGSPSASAADVLVGALTHEQHFCTLDTDLRKELTMLLSSAVQLPDASQATYVRFFESAPSPLTEQETAERVALLRRGVALFPDSVELRESLARHLDVAADAQEIIDVLAPLVGVRRSLFAGGRTYEALAALGQIPSAIAQLDALTNDSADEVFARALLKAETYVDAGMWSDAETAYTTIIPDAPLALRFQALVGASVLAFRAGAPDIAIARFTEAVTLYFENSDLESHSIHFLYYFDLYRESRLAEACQLVAAHFAITGHSPLPMVQAGLRYFDYKEHASTLDAEPEKLFDAFAAYPHPKLQGDLSTVCQRQRKITESVRHHLDHALWIAEQTRIAEPGHYVGSEAHPTRHAAMAIHTVFKTLLKTHRSERALCGVFWPFYRSFLRRIHFEDGRHATILATLRALDIDRYGTVTDWLDFARAAQLAEKLSIAETAYERYLQHAPTDAAQVYQCALVKQQLGKLDDALACCDRLLQQQPDDALSELRAKIEETRLTQREDHAREEARRRDEEEKRAVLARTAPDRWHLLDPYKRQLLATMSVINGFSDWAELATISGIGQQYLKGHYRKLIEFGMLLEQPGGRVVVNELLLPLIKPERQHTLVTKIIHADKRIAFKPIFNSTLESTVYNVLVRLFPNQLVCPNVSLQTIFQYDRMRDLLSQEEFTYYLRSQVDICVISTASYLPIICIEIDSHYHDAPAQVARDTMKDTIFEKGGVPLLRTRPYGRPTDVQIREHLCNELRAYGKALRQTDEQAGKHVSVLIEIDFDAFGGEPDK